MCVPGVRGPRAHRPTGLRAGGMQIRQITNGYVTSIMYHFIPIVRAQVGLSPTSNCHTCLQGYKYKFLMHYSQGVEGLHSPTIFR